MTVRVEDAGESKCLSVMERIKGSPLLERGPTSGWSQAINICKETE
jgi:hypothetical protein